MSTYVSITCGSVHRHGHCGLSVCHMATVYKQSLSPVTGHRSYSGLLFRCTPSECPVSMWKSASQGQRVTFLQLFGILPQGSSSVEACACAWVCAVCVHELFVFHAANCILLEERHCKRVLRWWQTEERTHTHTHTHTHTYTQRGGCIWNIEL